MTERITESLVRDLLSRKNYYNNADIVVEEQKSSFANINNLFNTASKSGKEHQGFPEFIIHNKKYPDFLIIIECKSDPKNHGLIKSFGSFKSELDYKAIKTNAIDGALYYAYKASSSFNVISIAVSGSDVSTLKVSCFLVPKKSESYKMLLNIEKIEIDSIIPFDDFVRHSNYDDNMRKMREKELIFEAKSIHQYVYENAKIPENEKPLLVAGILLALKDDQFVSSYDKLSPKKIMSAWFDAIGRTLEDATIPNAKIKNMHESFVPLKNHPSLPSLTNSNSKSVMHGLVEKIHINIFPFMNMYQDADIMGMFYGEFLKYSAGDQKSNGIALTPKHITELCCDLANITSKDIVLDPCAGTGGFLISAMHKMIKTVHTNEEANLIKQNNLIGVEHMPHMYTIACTNMILRGDGKSNLYQGSCFDDNIANSIKKFKPSKGLINPPYAQGDGKEELVFVNQMLDMLEKGGIGVALIPCSCGFKDNELKKKILSNHTLLGVMTMPTELFKPIAVNTSIMVFLAGTSHKESNIKTWFADFKNDEYVFNKDMGRHDKNGKWKELSKYWVDSFRNKEVVDGFSSTKYVNEDDEWIAEAYLNTDYSKVENSIFEDVIKNYRIHNLATNYSFSYDKLDTNDWIEYTLPELFKLKRGKWNKQTISTEVGNTPLITSTSRDNGINCYTNDEPDMKEVPCLTVANNGSVGETFVQDKPFIASSDVTVLIPHKKLSTDALLFIATILKMEKFKYNYGRKWGTDRMKISTIKLPTKGNEIDVEYMEKYISQLRIPIIIN